MTLPRAPGPAEESPGAGDEALVHALAVLLRRINDDRWSALGGGEEQTSVPPRPSDGAHAPTSRSHPASIQLPGTGGRVDPRFTTLLETARHKLAVYGTLAPGQPNHGQLAGLPGEWREGWVTGELRQGGWGSAVGYPGLLWRPAGARVRAGLFVSEALPAHWERLDRFEGDGYRRILVPFHHSDGSVDVANLYELAPEGG